MNSTLRRWIRKHGDAGVIVASIYLGLRYLWTKRRRETLLISLVLYGGTVLVLLRPTQRQHVPAISFPVPSKLPPAHAVTQHPRLLDRARKVAQADTWEPYFHDYFWLSDNEVLYCSETDEHSRYNVGVYRYNVTTHARRSLPRLSRLTYRLSTKHSLVHLSPDRQWFLWVDRDSEQAIAVTIDGHSHTTWPCHTYGTVGWLKDSRHWVEFAEDRRGKPVYSLIIRDRQVGLHYPVKSV